MQFRKPTYHTINFDEEDTFVDFLAVTIQAGLYREIHVSPTVYATRGGGRKTFIFLGGRSDKFEVVVNDDTTLFKARAPLETFAKVKSVLEERKIHLYVGVDDSDNRHSATTFLEASKM